MGNLRGDSLLAVLLAVAGIAACGSGGAGTANDDGRDRDAGAAANDGATRAPDVADAGDASVAFVDPFAPQSDTSEGLTNVSPDLDTLLERGALADACASYQPGKSTRKEMLLCGKSMFFDEGFGTAGVPVAFVQFLAQNFPNEIGTGFTKLGMVADPRSTNGYPLGLAPGAKLGSIETLAFTCASCHVAKLPDGRYAIGAPNLGLDYGTMNLALAVFPTVASGFAQASAQDPDAMRKVQPLIDKVNADAALKGKLLAAMLPLLGSAGNAPKFPPETQHLYASWKTGTMDFFIEPLPFNDHVHTISKISALWGMPTSDEIRASGMSSAMLGHTGSTASLMNFAKSFVQLGGGDKTKWPVDKLEPLVAYVYSLRAPKTPTFADATLVAKGRDLFVGKLCLGCHGAPRGSGAKVYTFGEIGTDAQMKLWCDPDQTGQPEYDIRFEPGDALTHGIKSPRLVGLWSIGRLLHNGSVDSLEELFCASGPRTPIATPAYGNEGHTFGCELEVDEKTALLAYLRAH